MASSNVGNCWKSFGRFSTSNLIQLRTSRVDESISVICLI